MADMPKQLPPDVAAALSRGNLIEAIKLLRGKYNIGLAEAKALLESLQKHASQAQIGMSGDAKPAPRAATTMHVGQPHVPHAAMHVDPNLSPGEVPRASSGAVFAFVIVALLFVLGAAFYFS
jgi:hypothetical protein